MATDTKTGGFRGPIQRIRYCLLTRQLMKIDGYPASLTLSFDGAGRNIRHAALVKSLGRKVRVEFYAPHDAYYEKSDREIAEFLAPQVALQVGIKPPSDGWVPSEHVTAASTR